MMATERDALEHAKQNAQSWLESIQEMVSRLEHAQECDGTEAGCNMIEYIEDGEGNEIVAPDSDIKPEEFDEYHDADKAREAIEESALSVEVSGKWTPGSEPEVTGYEILLTTGGPALRIVGDLGLYGEPSSAQLEMQDWGTPWTAYTFFDCKNALGKGDDWAIEDVGAFRETLLTFARCFYFGD